MELPLNSIDNEQVTLAVQLAMEAFANTPTDTYVHHYNNGVEAIKVKVIAKFIGKGFCFEVTVARD